MTDAEFEAFHSRHGKWFLLPGIGLFGWTWYDVARVCFGSLYLSDLGDVWAFLWHNVLIGGLGFVLICVGFYSTDDEPSPRSKPAHSKR